MNDELAKELIKVLKKIKLDIEFIASEYMSSKDWEYKNERLKEINNEK